MNRAEQLLAAKQDFLVPCVYHFYQRPPVLVRRSWYWFVFVLPVMVGLAAAGCKAISNRLTHWNMLGQEALEDPITAVGGDGIVFLPCKDGTALSRKQLAAANPETLVDYYSPI